MTEAPPVVPGECTCLNRYDHCPACQALEAAVKAEKTDKSKTPEKPRRRKLAAPPVQRDLETAELSGQSGVENISGARGCAPEPPALLLSAKEVARLLGLSVRTVWRMGEDGRLPRPVKWSRKLVRWSRAALLAWVERVGGGPHP